MYIIYTSALSGNTPMRAGMPEIRFREVGMIDISKLSSRYGVARLSDPDAEEVLRFCRENTQYYAYCEAEATLEQVLTDLHITPPGVAPADKYYLGFRRGSELMAVLDLIDGYPEPACAFIGFFMMNKAYQGRSLGSALIRELEQYLKAYGKTRVRLGIDKGNPQSAHFWRKNGYCVIREVPRDGGTVLVAEKML